MTKNYDPNLYGKLLVEYLPGVIQAEAENEKALAMVLKLMKKGVDGRSPEESRLLELLVTLIDDFESKEYVIDEQGTPSETLRYLMDEHGLKQTDMLDVFGSQGVLSQILNGKREISKSQARRLANRFNLTADLFI
jgi:HTH-type transcriptional regulator / antitoxin HigA